MNYIYRAKPNFLETFLTFNRRPFGKVPIQETSHVCKAAKKVALRKLQLRPCRPAATYSEQPKGI